MKETSAIKISFVSVVLAGLAGAVQAGEISGKVTLSGTPPPEITINMDATCGKMHTEPVTTRHYVVGEGHGLGDVFVYIKSGASKTSAATTEMVLDQKNCMYDPYIWGVVAGEEFKVRNSDNVLHNVHATPRINKEFNIGQPLPMVTTKSFEKPELMIRIKCDVHPWMFTYCSAVEHPFFAVTDKDGKFKIKDVPPGKYVIEAIHRKAGQKTEELTLGADDKKTLNFEMAVPAP